MAYTPNTWVARQGSGLNRYIDENGNYQTLTPAPESVTTPGTPFSADWMNHLEGGVQEAAATADTALATANAALPAASVDDYVVEAVSQNTQDGLYRYQKWNSGKVELWGWRNPGKVELPNQVTGLRYSDARTYALPSGLFTAIDYFNVWITNSVRIVWAVSNDVSTTAQIRWWIVSTYTASVDSTVREQFYVVGTWK